MKNVIISWSSGKDSTLTLQRLLADQHYNVVGLFTTYVEDAVPFQATPIDVVKAQASAIGLPLVLIPLNETFPSNEVYQTTIVTALKESGLAIDAVAFGDMYCNGIAEYRKSYIEPQGWECVLPLLGACTIKLANEIIQSGIETTITTVDTTQLTAEYCGLAYNKQLIATLPNGVDPCGEDGEFHTLVTNSPAFKRPLQIQLSHQENDGRFQYQRYKYIA
ncbi:Dph6-related ATP pyrophosphatase [Vibrio agarivorans]|uniref:Dph6-related ATP pyrophosphatase n=1 Tax=Vibrio agarivorans TaxID=153622 RepID=UPI0025B3CB61|nr:ATPase [Vibrio agarivorans]MDN3661853.1 ATPase [Vibrio agarivorans]